MLKLRLKRLGRKKLPYYRIVVMESKSKRNGLPIKEVGNYNPIDGTSNLNSEEILRFLKNGAKPTKTVSNLLVKSNIVI